MAVAVPRTRAVSMLLAAITAGTTASCATDLAQPWRALAWLAFAACVAWALVCLVVITRTDRRR